MIVKNVTSPEFARSLNFLVDHENDRSTMNNKFSMEMTKPINPILRYQENFTTTIEAIASEITASTAFNQPRDTLYIVIPITIIYVLIFFTGLVGNVSTCVVIARNRSMHTATNYYLFSLAVSDLLLLISGLPSEMYYIWSHFPYVFGEIFCIVQSFAAETSANATVLTITAFTVERYVAICHPFISHTMSKLSRAVKFVILIWIMALCLAIPQAIQFGLVFSTDENGTVIPSRSTCSRKWVIIEHAFEISTVLFFVLPMTIITVLYLLIGLKLRGSRLLTTGSKRNPISSGINHSESSRGRNSSQRNVIRMLVAVVVAFFICWAPFHAQRLLAVYAERRQEEPAQDALVIVYTALTYVSGVFYYLSTTVNPLLYNIMSNKFREAFKSMLADHCVGRRSLQKTNPRRPNYSSFTKNGNPTTRPGIDRNTGSLSASEELQRLTTTTRHDVVQKHCPPESCEITKLTNDHTKNNENNHSSEITKLCKNDFEKTNGSTEGKNSTLSSLETNSRMNDTIVSIGSRRIINRGNNNNFEIDVQNCLAMGHRLPKTNGLGLIAERLRFGTKCLFANSQQTSQNNNNRQLDNREKFDREPIDKSSIVAVSRGKSSDRVIEKFRSHPSLESANTISNTSLRDVDETEFTGSELASYMGQLNFDLVT